MPVKSSGVLFERGARKLGLASVPRPDGDQLGSRTAAARPACIAASAMGYGCEVMAKSSIALHHDPRGRGHRSLRSQRPTVTSSTSTTDERGRVTGVTYLDLKKRENFQKARAVVLCANGAETPRLLLNSASSRFPDGLANSSGLVGKYLMFNYRRRKSARCSSIALNEYKSAQVTRIVHDFYDSDPKRGFYGGGGHRRTHRPAAHLLGDARRRKVRRAGARNSRRASRNFRAR